MLPLSCHIQIAELFRYSCVMWVLYKKKKNGQARVLLAHLRFLTFQRDRFIISVIFTVTSRTIIIYNNNNFGQGFISRPFQSKSFLLPKKLGKRHKTIPNKFIPFHIDIQMSDGQTCRVAHNRWYFLGTPVQKNACGATIPFGAHLDCTPCWQQLAYQWNPKSMYTYNFLRHEVFTSPSRPFKVMCSALLWHYKLIRLKQGYINVRSILITTISSK